MATSNIELERQVQQLQYDLGQLASAVAELADTVNRWGRGYIDGHSAGSSAQSVESKAKRIR